MAEENYAAELSAFNFDQIIGAPLTATINAQAGAAMTTLDFIRNVGFKPRANATDAFELSTVDFSFQKQLPMADGSGATSISNQNVTVPMLSIVPVPFIRVDKLEIDLNVQIHSIQKQETKNEFQINADASYSGWFSPVKLSVSASTRNATTGKSTVDKQYSLGVKVHAVQDEMPSGLAKVLGIFDELVQARTVLEKAA